MSSNEVLLTSISVIRAHAGKLPAKTNIRGGLEVKGKNVFLSISMFLYLPPSPLLYLSCEFFIIPCSPPIGGFYTSFIAAKLRF